MFRKLVSNLPFSPSLIHQLGFYAKRLHQERSLRRLGALFTGLAMTVQVIAVLAPAQPSLASHENDLISGASSKDQVLAALQANKDSRGHADIQQIYGYYGITIDDVRSATITQVHSKEQAYTSTGRGDSPGIDTPVTVPGAPEVIYERALSAWDVANPENCYNAATGTASGNGILKGRQFWVLMGYCGTTTGGCGNIVFIELPKTPKLEITKVRSSSSNARPGETVNYVIQYRNSGTGTATNAVIRDTLASEYQYDSQSSSDNLAFSVNNNVVTWRVPILQPGSWHQINLSLKVKSISGPSRKVCNAASITSADGSVIAPNTETERCVNVDNVCPGTTLPIPSGGVEKCQITCPDGTVVAYNAVDTCPSPVASCDSLQIIGQPAWDKRQFEAAMTLNKGAKLSSVRLLVNDKVVKDFGGLDATKKLDYSYQFPAGGSYTASIEATAQKGTTYYTNASCRLMEQVVQPFTRPVLSKKVSNITQNITDANHTKAKAGDVLEYTLTVANEGNIDMTNYIIDSDKLSDVLEYATLLNYDGASYDSVYQRLTWPATTVPKGQSISRTFRIHIKDPIPSTAPAASNPLSYDYKLWNFFGNEVEVDVDRPVEGQVQHVVTELPNTGPGSSLVVSFIAMSVIGFFYARSRLLAKEVDIIRTDSTIA